MGFNSGFKGLNNLAQGTRRETFLQLVEVLKNMKWNHLVPLH